MGRGVQCFRMFGEDGYWVGDEDDAECGVPVTKMRPPQQPLGFPVMPYGKPEKPLPNSKNLDLEKDVRKETLKQVSSMVETKGRRQEQKI